MNNDRPDIRTQPIPLTDAVTKSEEEARILGQSEDIQVMQVAPQPVDKAVMQLRAEELVPTKEWIESGAVLIKKGIEVHPQTIPVEILHEEVKIEHVPINRVLPEGEVAAPWQDGDVLVIPVVHEELVITKQRIVREELRISKVRIPTTQTISDTVRRETISLDTTGNVRVMPDENSEPGG